MGVPVETCALFLALIAVAYGIVCPTPLCANKSCYIDTPLGYWCPTCICKDAGYGIRVRDLESEDSSRHETVQSAGPSSEVIGRESSEGRTIKESRDQSSSSSSIESSSETEDNETERNGSHSSFEVPEELIRDNLDPPIIARMIRKKRSRIHRAASFSDNSLQQQQQQQSRGSSSADYEDDVTGGIEREDDDVNEIQIFGSNGRSASSVNNAGGVTWITNVPGCPTPICADSSCRIGVPAGQDCPTCIC